MDKIKFSQGVYCDEDTGYGFWTIDISINGRKLLDIVKGVERENARRMGLEFGGEYAGIRYTPNIVAGEHFLGRKPYANSSPFVWVLGCTCGFFGCWDVFASVEVTSTIVRWSEIFNPWLANGLPSVWHQKSPEDFVAFDYSSIGPFVFDRKQYDESLSKLGPAV
jgi:hypothetical protein